MADSKAQVAVLKSELQNIKEKLSSIESKLDNKYITTDEHNLAIASVNSAIGWIVKIGIFLATPIYAATIALLFKVFTN